MRCALALSLALLALTSTIKFVNVLPSLIMLAVLSIFRISFCAVPAFIRVDPVKISGPTAAQILIAANVLILPLGLQLTLILAAPS